MPEKADPPPRLRVLSAILGNAGFRRGEGPGMRLVGVGMDGVGVVERDEGLVLGGGERRADPLGWSLEGLRMLRGATSGTGKGCGDAERSERGPIGLAGLGWRDCMVPGGEEDDGRRQRLATA